MKENWKPIKGYESNYEVSDMGNVRNKKTKKIIIGDKNNMGYRRVTLYTPIKKRFFVHRLVAYHFCRGYKEDLVVNHKDGNKLNNKTSNLEWVTRSQNDLHAYKNDLRHVHIPYHKGDVYYQVCDYTTGILIKEYDSRENFYKDYPMSNKTFQTSVVRGWFFKDWHHKNLGKLKLIRVFK